MAIRSMVVYVPYNSRHHIIIIPNRTSEKRDSLANIIPLLDDPLSLYISSSSSSSSQKDHAGIKEHGYTRRLIGVGNSFIRVSTLHSTLHY